MKYLYIIIIAWTLFLAPLNAYGMLKVRAWQSTKKFPTADDFPEFSLPEITSRANAGIAFSGGGSRSYLVSLGYLAALTKLKLIGNARYMCGISGGSWATAMYSYAQNVDDMELLGDIIDPKDISDEGLKVMPSKCARGFTSDKLVAIGYQAYKNGLVSSLAEAWSYAVQKMYLDPVGISTATPFAWSESQVAEIKARNPSLSDSKFLLPSSKDRPFMIIGTALVGPTEGSPYHDKQQNMTMIEFTPMYTGQMKTLDVDYHYSSAVDVIKTLRVGGAVENYAFGRSLDNKTDTMKAPVVGLPVSSRSGILIVPPTKAVDLQYVAGSSSYDIGCFLEASAIPTIPDKAGLHFDYWSPADSKPKSKDTLFGDGGCFENVMIINMLQRKVDKIAAFFNHKVPLQPSATWNAAENPNAYGMIDSMLPSFFGVYPTDGESDASQHMNDRVDQYTYNQVFSTSDYVMVIQALQAAQQKGFGIIATFNLTTVENEWWGIPAGVTSEITFVYLGRLLAWEAQLSPEMQALVVPPVDETGVADPSVTIDEGEYRGFPHYQTAGGLITSKRANLLSDMTGWSLLQHKELFSSIFTI